MSETPQETLEQFCRELERESDTQGTRDPESVELAEAIRAVLAQLEKPLDVPRTTSCGHTWTMRHTACPTCFGELKVERDALRAEVERLAHDSAEWSTIANHRTALLERSEAALLSIEEWAREQLGGAVPAHFILNRVRDARAARE
jgi:hypothetical protein